jgi:hypothetical protein
VPFTWLSPLGVQWLHTILHVVAYILLYFTWASIFSGLGLTKAYEKLAETLPVWLVFSAFWGDISYLNIYIIVALLASFLIKEVLEECLGWSLLWLSILLQVKPQWAFAAALPLLLGNRRFFLKLIGLAAAVYVAVLGLTLLVTGPAYGWAQMQAYVNLLGQMSANFPWRGLESGFIGYNHSVKQIVAFLFGASPAALRAAEFVKTLLLLPLAAACLRFLWAPKSWHASPETRLELAFALYLGTFLWLDIFWELSLSIVIYSYLLSSLPTPTSRNWLRVIFLPYAFLDVWQAASYAVIGPAVLIQGAYVATDPSIYLPVMMLILLAFLAILTRRLWHTVPGLAPQSVASPLKGETL